MAKMSAEEITKYIKNYVAKCPDRIRPHWYVGIATDPESRLFEDHRVNRKYTKWVYCPAVSVEAARLAEKSLLDDGYDGGPGGGDHPTFVYAFHKERYTDPNGAS